MDTEVKYIMGLPRVFAVYTESEDIGRFGRFGRLMRCEYWKVLMPIASAYLPISSKPHGRGAETLGSQTIDLTSVSILSW